MIKLIDGSKNSVVCVYGEAPGLSKPLVKLKELSGEPKSVRLEGILYSIENTVYLNCGDIIIPLAGRGKLNFEEFHALPLTEDICLNGSGTFFLMLDMEKL